MPKRTTKEMRGMECPGCGCRDLRVVYTRPEGGKRIFRRRECRHCGRRTVTVEKVV